ncbi:MAG: AMP-binding protein [Rhodobacteraceae bacterium]|nr:AMP-binding protein [Paracoccaceae bacterium]
MFGTSSVTTASPRSTISAVHTTERRRLLEHLEGGTADGPGRLNLHALFEDQARSRPTEPAVVSEVSTLTYGELDRRANRLANHLRGIGVGPEMRVGVCLGRSPDLITAVLAVLKAGGSLRAPRPCLSL